jgi:Na+-driven multidrug efflux pump
LGISSLLTQVSIVVIMAVMNNCLVAYGAQSVYGADIPLTVVGIVMKVFQLVIAFVVGIAAGCQPIVGYNFGAGKIDRVRTLFRKMVIAEVIVGLVSLIIFQCFPLQIISIFGSGDALYEEFAALAFRIYLAGIILCCIQKSCSIFLQALGKPVLSMALSLLRDFVLIVPLALLLSKEMGVVGALWSAPLADIGAFVVTVLIMAHTLRHALGKAKEPKAVPAN